jgi:hypothetical protein
MVHAQKQVGRERIFLSLSVGWWPQEERHHQAARLRCEPRGGSLELILSARKKLDKGRTVNSFKSRKRRR